jgi:predicted dinucleotide-binding enzyme
MQVTIIGAGNMANGIGTRALKGKHRVRLIDKDTDKARALADDLRQRMAGADVQAADADGIGEADIVVLALPFPAGRQIVASYGEELVGKTVVDISNPVDLSTFDSLVVAPGTSAAEEIAKASVPGVRVVKAFNTTFAGTLVAGGVAGVPLDVFIAGDDEVARKQVADLASSGGLNPVDVGPLKHARELEGFQLLHMKLQQSLGSKWMSGIKVLMPDRAT